MISAHALERAFQTERPLKGFVVPGLAFSYQPRESLTIGRADRPPDDEDIALVIALAREAFIILSCEPQREVIEPNGIIWYLARWPIQRELVADHLPLKEREKGETDEPEYLSPKPALLRHV